MYHARSGEKRGGGASPLKIPLLLKMTRDFLCEERHVRGKAVAVMDLGPHCPCNESIFVAFFARRLPSSGDMMTAGGRTQFQGMLLEAPQVVVAMAQAPE